MCPWIRSIAPRVGQVAKAPSSFDVVIKDVGPDVEIAASDIKCHQHIHSVVGTICNYNNGRSNAETPHKDQAQHTQPSEAPWEPMIAMTGPDKCRNDKDHGVATEHAIATSVKGEGGKEFADRMNAAVSRIRKRRNSDGGDSHNVAECPCQEHLAEKIERSVVCGNHDGCWDEQESICQVGKP